jgi:hypothetical protein
VVPEHREDAGDLAQPATVAHNVRERPVLAGGVELVEEAPRGEHGAGVVARRRRRSARECVGSGTSVGAERDRAAAAFTLASAAARMAAARSAGVRMGFRSSCTAGAAASAGGRAVDLLEVLWGFLRVLAGGCAGGGGGGVGSGGFWLGDEGKGKLGGVPRLPHPARPF